MKNFLHKNLPDIIIISAFIFSSFFVGIHYILADYGEAETTVTITAPPVVDCVGSWADTSTCSVSCEVGVKQQLYTITTAQVGTGASCPYADGETRWGSTSCDTGVVCPVNCVGSWGSDTCTASCGGGVIRQTYDITIPQAGTGTACPYVDGATRNLTTTCNTQVCPVNCVGSWADNGTCSASCNSGVIQQTYDITIPQAGTGTACPYVDGATRWGTTTCNTQVCPVNCVGSWADNGTCSASCDGGVIQQTYDITTPKAGTGISCPYTDGATRWGSTSCNTQSCASPGVCGWSDGQSFYVAPTGLYCDVGTASAVSGSGPWTWSCSGLSGGTSASCSAYKAVAGECSGSHYYCNEGNSTSNSNNLSNWSWTCSGINWGSDDYCSESKPAPTASLSASPLSVAYDNHSTLTWSSTNATSCTTSANWSTSGNLSGSGWTDNLKANATFTLECFGNGQSSGVKSVTVTVGKLDGVCAATHSNCTIGVSANPVDGATTWTWSCNGDNGGINASCTENKASGSISGSDCIIAPGANSCSTSLNINVSNPVVGAATNVTKTGNVEVISNATINNTFPKTVNNITVSYPSTTFFLNHNTNTLGSTTVNASCEGGVPWDASLGVCSKVPTLTSPTDALVTALGATLGATITDLGTSSTLIERGVCYGTMPNPSLVNGATCTLNGELVVGAYTVKILGLLSPETYYYYRGYATNGAGTGYSAEGNFTTLVRPPSAKVLKFESDIVGGRIDFGKSVKLTWESTNSLYGCSITSDGVPPINMTNLSSTNLVGLSFKPAKTTIYTLTCDGEGGKDSFSSESLKIQVGKMNPQFNEF